MKFSEIKTVISFCNENNIEDWKEVVENIKSGESDFEINDFRFISSEEIDNIQTGELESDPYILGCFNSAFISECTGWPEILISAAQKGENYEEIGQELIDGDFVKKIQEMYSGYDSYGHHFGHYDGETHEDLLHLNYYAFQI